MRRSPKFASIGGPPPCRGHSTVEIESPAHRNAADGGRDRLNARDCLNLGHSNAPRRHGETALWVGAGASGSPSRRSRAVRPRCHSTAWDRRVPPFLASSMTAPGIDGTNRRRAAFRRVLTPPRDRNGSGLGRGVGQGVRRTVRRNHDAAVAPGAYGGVALPADRTALMARRMHPPGRPPAAHLLPKWRGCASFTPRPPGACRMTADEIIARLNLTPHPEGGHYRQTWVADKRPPDGHLHLLPSEGRRVEPLAQGRCDRDLALARGAPLVLSMAGRTTARPAIICSPPISPGAHRRLIVPEGHWQGARTTGDYTAWSPAPSRRASPSRGSPWPRRA